MTQKIALLYARVSTNRQAETGHSLDSQSALLIKQAESEGYKVELVLENGSGRKANRPKLNEALERLNKGEAQALFALDSDRLARSTLHLLQISETAKRKGWRLVIASLKIDTGTPQGKLMLGMLANFAEFESDLISERVKRQHQARRERGVIWGLTEGYRGNLDPKTRRFIVKAHTAGQSLRAIARELEATLTPTPRGGKWEPATIRAILQSPQSKVLLGRELMERAGADFRPLIEALQSASADPQATLSEQLSVLELFLVSAQLNPNPIPAVELAYSLRVLGEIDTQGINPSMGTADLANWFDRD